MVIEETPYTKQAMCIVKHHYLKPVMKYQKYGLQDNKFKIFQKLPQTHIVTLCLIQLQEPLEMLVQPGIKGALQVNRCQASKFCYNMLMWANDKTEKNIKSLVVKSDLKKQV